MEFFNRSLLAGIAVITTGLSAQGQEDALANSLDQDGVERAEAETRDQTETERATFSVAGEITHQGGEAVYNAVCSGCHLPNGEGAVGAGAYPALANNELLASAAYPIYLVVNGQKAMPPIGMFLDDQQIVDVVNYIRSNFGNDFIEEYGEATAEEVAETRQ